MAWIEFLLTVYGALILLVVWLGGGIANLLLIDKLTNGGVRKIWNEPQIYPSGDPAGGAMLLAFFFWFAGGGIPLWLGIKLSQRAFPDP